MKRLIPTPRGSVLPGSPVATFKNLLNTSVRTALATALATLSLTGPATADEALLIGGGYDLQGSQGQIELNVKWVQGILQEQGLPVSTWFTDGDEPGPDVHYHVLPDAGQADLEPLARVFGDWVLEQRRYREHSVENVTGSTRRDDLEPQLRQILQERSDQDLLMVYNGHGSQSHGTPDQVVLNLWDDTALSARELHSWLAPHDASFRFIFTQCYSGGFHRLAYADPSAGNNLSGILNKTRDGKPNGSQGSAARCGFTAESAYRLAEGCSASIDTDDYRDYTTFFFAALAGQDRNARQLPTNPDRDGDGSTTLREAHLYTLAQAYSTDLSRSTSEDWLDQWQPWYLRWLPAPDELPDNDYASLLQELALRHDISLENASSALPGKAFGALRHGLRQRLTQADQQWRTLEQNYRELGGKVRELQYQLQFRLSTVWPELLGPYTSGYVALAESGRLQDIARQTRQLPDYQLLQRLQDDAAALELDILDAERMATQFRKMIRLHRLALLEQQLGRFGSEQDRADYQSLRSCEQVPLRR